ncbi:hypothetical protein NLM59_10945 [Weeksellaceae bacterium KMM 9724]|uniref:DsrE family protein n=1 Tax=Profundicola chukchiensis TaxID=2961959 RepID=UPI00243ADC3B|nr:hypothetical protein [Profundicola chukchiensis]MDG4951438.1 hypothetical protein [Profundicola chukchiensis]
MKNHILVILFLMIGSFLNTTNLSAQNLSLNEVENSIKADGKYALLVSNARHLQAAVMTGEELKSQHPNLDFQIILIGPVVKDLAEDKSLEPSILKSQKLDIRIVVCEFAMNHLGVKKSQYHPYINTTPNGFTYIFGLQENGYKTITL